MTSQLLQPLRWCCVKCVIHHERDVREEQHHTCMWREQAKIEFTCHDHSVFTCSRHIRVWCCSSRTSRSWWITHLTQHHRRDCNTCEVTVANSNYKHFYSFLTSTSAPHFEKGSATFDSMHSSNPLTSDHYGFCAEPSPENLHQGGFTFVWVGLDIENLIKTPMIHSVPYYDLGGLSPPNPPPVATALVLCILLL